MPDAERLASSFLRDQAEVSALVGSRVYTALPDDKTYPLVRLVRIGGSPQQLTEDGLLWDSATFQVDTWGGSKALTWQVAETLRAALAERVRGEHATGWVEGVELGAARYVPDTTHTPARPRVLFDFTLTLRPLADRVT